MSEVGHTHAENHEHPHDGNHIHAHDSGHEHTHHHSHTQTKAVLNRLSRIEGHIASIKTMVADGRDCSEVLTQLSAVDAAVKSTAKVILEDHFKHCIAEAMESGDEQAIQEFYEALKHFI